ncbi:Mor transcription activator family protein [Nitrosomonas sp.]|uniref:Mor transcription activator family protein n=1 Tax=Nitrosomonas sp. TaxID=42353 RepID=UPI001D9AF06C|nr:Mor transcription activator family protein [Nitrosomonas sp.]MCB1950154.1 hypothetical protein [Nitrosomonas sp.]
MSDIPKKHEMPELLTVIVRDTADTLKECISIDADTAEHVGHEVALRVAQRLAKQLVYIPSAENFLKHGRDEEIWRDFSGGNHNELARKYGISVQWVYRIIKKMHQIKSKEVQGSLFDETD